MYSVPIYVRSCSRLVKTIVTILLAAGVCAFAEEGAPERELRSYLASKSERGSVFAQGTLDGIDYRKLLRGAVAKKSASLAGIFRYTANGKLMGEGAESNCDILRQLLRLWGDAAYAHVLASEAPKVRAAVIGALDYGWHHPGWKPTQYPLTYHLAKHDTSNRQ
jgi:hypothetical protein